MEKTLLIAAVILAAIGVALGVLSLILSKKKGRGDGVSLSELEQLNNNLNEVKNIIEGHVTKEKDNAVQSVTATVTALNVTLTNSINTFLQSFKTTVDKSLDVTEENLEKIRREMKSAAEDMRKGAAESSESLKKDTARELDNMRQSLSTLLNTQMENFGSAIDKMNESVKNSLKEVRDDNRSQLERVRDNNAQQLEKMRQTVDEKLTSTLNERINNAFNLVNQSLESVNKGFGEMRELTGQVGNLNKMFANVKTRGNWGEVELESILDNMLAPDQYKRQFRIGKSAELVDFAVVMPNGDSGEKLYLPIDAKFPGDKYAELVKASERGDVAGIEAARKELAAQIKREAVSIKQKYVKPPKTTPFAIMFLPSEGLYAEIIKDTALISQLQNEHKITICGPTTMSALLNSLRMGFMTLRIQKSSSEIAKALQQFQKDFATYSSLVSKIKKNADDIVKTVDKVEEKNQKISLRLDKVVGNLPHSQDAQDISLEGEKQIASDIDETGEE